MEALLRQHEIVAVVTQPDRPAHRGRRLTPPPVKAKALAAGLPVVQPARLRDPEWPARLAEFGADVAVVVAFGQILPKVVLQVPALGSINVHASLLPRYRGAAPIQWALIRGETVTGVTTFQMDEGMDTGPILMSATTPIGANETAGELAARLAALGAGLLVDTLAHLDTLTPTPQRHEEATLAPRLKKTDGHLELARPARELVNLIRGCNPWPGAVAKAPTGQLT
ncbi:MAG TPA: methionyl-tRNA formyltransferase, partial [Candidatus Elarobacter sp.]|nr:methionyl-tRNA formyltransferase [Candidatus Elarobacter sp.]